jgi:hypothetical protein
MSDRCLRLTSIVTFGSGIIEKLQKSPDGAIIFGMRDLPCSGMNWGESSPMPCGESNYLLDTLWTRKPSNRPFAAITFKTSRLN